MRGPLWAKHVMHPISHRPREIGAEPGVRLGHRLVGPRLPKVGPDVDADHAHDRAGEAPRRLYKASG